MRNYELTIVVPSDVSEDDLNGVITQIQGWVEATQGKVVKTDHWGRKRLAYHIAEYREAHYVMFHLELEPNAVTEVERNLKLSDKVIRYLVVRKDS
jgi:small subunit ribosomal protein S6